MAAPQPRGLGLAEPSARPARLADLTGAVAAILEQHMQARDLTDTSSWQELQANRRLAKQHRDAAAQLHAIATEMADYRELPMGRHDEAQMAVPAAGDVFEQFVQQEQELMTLLEKRLEQDRPMLAEMRAVRSTA